MSVTILPEKKWCPYCHYTVKTVRTHCPYVGDYPALHEYYLSVPLEICKPDTSNYHKEAGSRSHRNYKTTLPQDLPKLPKIITDLDTIRMMQKRARKKGLIDREL